MDLLQAQASGVNTGALATSTATATAIASAVSDCDPTSLLEICTKHSATSLPCLSIGLLHGTVSCLQINPTLSQAIATASASAGIPTVPAVPAPSTVPVPASATAFASAVAHADATAAAQAVAQDPTLKTNPQVLATAIAIAVASAVTSGASATATATVRLTSALFSPLKMAYPCPTGCLWPLPGSHIHRCSCTAAFAPANM